MWPRVYSQHSNALAISRLKVNLQVNPPKQSNYEEIRSSGWPRLTSTYLFISDDAAVCTRASIVPFSFTTYVNHDWLYTSWRLERHEIVQLIICPLPVHIRNASTSTDATVQSTKCYMTHQCLRYAIHFIVVYTGRFLSHY